MKNLLRYLAFVLMVGGVCAQNNLPPCQGSDIASWSNCLGTNNLTNGNRYVGDYKDGKQHGEGTYIATNGDKYVGQWRNGGASKGTLTFATGEIYIGEFKDGMKHGQGSLTLPGGVKYIGEFSNDKFNGQGVMIYSSGERYDGEFKENKRHGQGTFDLSKGNKYIGEFKDDKFDGLGTFYAANGSIEQGIFANNKFIRSAPVQQIILPNKEIERLRAEAEEAKRKQSELENQLKLTKPSSQTNSSPLDASSTDRRLALVVGNANYKIHPLKNPRNDADDISRSLRSSGFEVIDLRDASLQQMRNGVRQFGDRLINNDVGLVYYSGHGVEVKGRNYFIPVNADIMREDEIADQGLDVSLILEKMNTAGKGVNILIVDACRDDPFGRSFRSSSRGLAQMDAPRGTIIAYATSPGKVASDGDPRERNSPYTKNLVRAMQQPNKPIEQVFKEVRRAVQEETKNQQTPWENTSLSGDFYFRVTR